MTTTAAHRLALDLTDNQLRALLYALEFTARVGIGQFERIADLHALEWLKGAEGAESWYDREQRVMRACKDVLLPGFHPHASYGIHSPKVDKRAKQAWEIMSVIREQDKTNRGFDTVHSHCKCDTGEPLPKCELKAVAHASPSSTAV